MAGWDGTTNLGGDSSTGRDGGGGQEGRRGWWAGWLLAWSQMRLTGRRAKETGRQAGGGGGASRELRQTGSGDGGLCGQAGQGRGRAILLMPCLLLGFETSMFH